MLSPSKARSGPPRHKMALLTFLGLLAPVYSSTILYWLSDTSDGFEDTWGYLDRRLSDVLKIPMYKAKAQQALGRLPSPLGLLKRLKGAPRPDAGPNA